MGAYTTNEMVQRAATEINWDETEIEKKKNYALCDHNAERLYISHDDSSEKERLRELLNENGSSRIGTIWMKKAPKIRSSELLREYFQGKERKPIIHVGHVCMFSASDRQGLKELLKDGFDLRVWQTVSEEVKPSEYSKSLKCYLELLREEVTLSIEPCYMEEKMAVIACGEDETNHVLTNENIMYRSDSSNGRTVVEELLINQADVSGIDTLWIKKAPLSSDSDQLLEAFRQKRQKPVLHIGHIHKYTAQDRQGLKNLLKEGFKLNVWEHASEYIKQNYKACLQEYLDLLRDETEASPNEEPMNYTEHKVAVISCGEDRVTHLLTNKGKMYRNSYELDQHAEVVIQSAEERACGITKIWIKNSPCCKCAKVLLEFFSDAPKKPVMYVGSIYQPDDENDKSGLLSLLQVGFKIEAWETMSTLLYGKGNSEIEKYLSCLREEVAARRNGVPVSCAQVLALANDEMH